MAKPRMKSGQISAHFMCAALPSLVNSFLFSLTYTPLFLDEVMGSTLHLGKVSDTIPTCYREATLKRRESYGAPVMLRTV